MIDDDHRRNVGRELCRAATRTRRKTKEQEGDEQEITNNEKGNAEDCRIERPGQKTALPMNV